MNALSHIAIIMDGNGRWAVSKKKARKFGHLKGTENILEIIKYCIKKKIPYLTLFAFGIDNWKRPKSEVFYIFSLLKKFLEENLKLIQKENIKINFIGEKKNIPIDIKKLIKQSELFTKDKKKLNLFIAINYSSKLEILSAIKKIVKNNSKITSKNLKNNLYTGKAPDPDILIRTGGHKRLSNFLLWQCSYTEFFFIRKLWPDFNVRDLKSIIFKFKNLKRNFGKI